MAAAGKKENLDGWRGLLKSPREIIHNFQIPIQRRNIITLLSFNVVILIFSVPLSTRLAPTAWAFTVGHLSAYRGD